MTLSIQKREYMDSWEKFEKAALPPKKSFFSTLTEENIKDEEYSEDVWRHFAIPEYMLYGGNKWVESTLDGLENVDETSEIGRMNEIYLIVFLEYPQHLHRLGYNLTIMI